MERIIEYKNIDGLYKHNEYISFHIFCKDLTAILRDAVIPFLEENHTTFSRYFFIRYWEGGPHIRLRLMLKYKDSKVQLIEQIKLFFNNLLDDSKGERIALTEYIPEVNRYAGNEGVKLAEEQFYVSSIFVLRFIEAQSKGNYYQQAIQTAIKYNLSLCASFNLEQREFLKFQKQYFLSWFYYIYVSKNQLLGFLKKVFGKIYFRYLFNHQKDHLTRFIINEWDRLKEISETDKAWYRKINEDLYKKLKNEHDLFKTKQPDLKQKSRNDKRRIILNQLESYIHMNNNRLGISNQDESLISYYIFKSFINNKGKV